MLQKHAHASTNVLHTCVADVVLNNARDEQSGPATENPKDQPLDLG